MSGDTPPLKLHICNARGELTGCAGWIGEAVRATHARASRYLPLGPLDVILRAGRQVIPEKGHVGLAPGPGIVILTVDPENPALEANADESLERMVAHEFHHAARWDGPGYGRTLGATLVSEGLACHFAQELFGAPLEPWEVAVPDALATWGPRIRDDWRDASYDHGAWFFGTGEMPNWLGYSAAYQLVARYFAEHPTATASALAHDPPEHFRALV
ncbi:DUF2268 domain-containing putative Zn-dependent protease [Vannielia litorea]|uniref:DUF2268 domain-containing putative Zn-dependent protease n=1 Tax=Vannielia litorea TaxID=1217970 RepID=UPI001BCF6A00|nr:DUF2268 domain-containing putative Zn-dependent protease [Vannielia litorea]MBS8226791.1 peptidase [Vannielia litorea]